ncbi:hypothetical protein SO802_011841 [Lithocarpus litseifolius]|uniref:CCHC-type domain-containing protein n=1 Tax=Lithocarpus litseifolius TaxID=425828 RepID=A0AAW2D4K7_9ROSI
MEHTVVEGLLNLHLTKEEEEEIPITAKSRADLLEECSLSLFGRLLTDRNQNLRALKNTLRLAWKMGSDLQIVEVGNKILQFKFNSEFQLQWVERNGPWNFENNLLLLCRWRKGLSVSNIVFTHSPFWVQIWGLPFEHMSLDVGKELGNSLGRFIESDRRTGHSDQAKFMRIRVDLQLDKPLRRGGKVASFDGDKFWVSFKYERLPVFCFLCGRLGHDDKHCKESMDFHNASRQYGDWLRAYGNTKAAGDKTRSTSSDGGGEGLFEDGYGMENYTHTTAKNSSDSVKDGSLGSIGGGNISGAGRTGERDGGSTGRTSTVRSERIQVEESLRVGDYTTRAGCTESGNSLAHADYFPPPPPATSNDLGLAKTNEDASLIVGQKAQEENELMEVSGPIEPTPPVQAAPISMCESGPLSKSMGQRGGKKPKAKVHLKKIARDKGRAKAPESEIQQIPVGSKRLGKLLFEEEEEIPSPKKRCIEAGPPQPTIEERSAVAALQHRREQ